MFGLASRYRSERYDSDPGVVLRRKPLAAPPPQLILNGHSPLKQQEDEMDEETYERTARLCSSEFTHNTSIYLALLVHVWLARDSKYACKNVH